MSVSKTNKTIPEWSAVIALSLFPYINVMTIALYLKVYGIEFMPGKTVTVSIFALFMIFNFYLFLRNDFYKSIIKKYDKLKHGFAGSIIVQIYIIGSFITFLLPLI